MSGGIGLLAASTPQLSIGRLATGRYIRVFSPNTLKQGVAPTLNIPYAVPVTFWKTMTFDRVGIGVDTGGTAGSVVRFGLYADSGGLPGDLISDWGTAASTASSALSVVTVAATVSRGEYWFVLTAQVASPTLFMAVSSLCSDADGNECSAYAIGGLKGTSTSGAYATPFGAPTGVSEHGPLIVIRGA